LEERENEQVYIFPEKINVFGREVKNISNYPLPQEEFKELSSVASDVGIKPSLFSTGIKALASRQCHDIRSTLKDILQQIKDRSAMIKKIPAYFVSLCQNVELEDLNVPENLLDESSSGCSSTETTEPPHVDLLQQKRIDFAEKINTGFQSGSIQFVLSPDGTENKILTCSMEGFSYIKSGHIRNAYWKELPEKLLNDIFFL